MEVLEDEYAIGLDLGTTFSCIGVYRNGGVEIIPNSKGEKTTPSIVIFTKDLNIKVGEETTDFLVENYESCIYEIKRIIGREFDDKEFQEKIKKLPFKIVKSNTGKTPEVQVETNSGTKTYNAIVISSFIIKHMIQNAEKYLNRKIKNLVITVPAYFNESQRNSTMQAAELAGVKVLEIINEPTAAALSYGFDQKKDINEKILVFDLGGGTFDVSILSIKKDDKSNNDKDKEQNKSNYISFEVKGTSGDTNLGGEDFDNELVDYILKKAKFNEKEIKNDKKAMKKLKVSCEIIKKILSSAKQTILRIQNFYKNKDIIESITRKEFEDNCEHLFKKLEISLEDALKNAKLKAEDIHEIILVGGSTKIPKVKEIIRNYFKNSKINDIINPDEAVAFGATLRAEKILHNRDEAISNLHLLDAIPLSLGTNIKNISKDENIKKEGDIMSVIIKRGTHIPITETCEYFNAVNNQKTMSLNIYEGEKKYVKYNHLIKETKITGLTPRKMGETKVLVTFEIDVNGILTVKAEEKSNNNEGQKIELTTQNDDNCFTQNELDELKRENKEMFEKMKNNSLTLKIDYINLNQTLKQYQDSYNNYKKEANNEDDDDPRIIYKENFNSTLENFIEKLEKKFDNETVLEKFYLYVKELFLSYTETLKLALDKGEEKQIMNKIKEYIEVFINKSSCYLNDLLEILKGIGTKKKLKIFFYSIIIFVLERLNKEGKECIKSNKQFCKYHSLMYFEQANMYYKMYLSNIDENLLNCDDKNLLKEQKEIFIDFINFIKCGAIVLCEDSFKAGRLISEEIISTGRGITNDLKKFAIGSLENNVEKYKIILSNYESTLSTIQASDKPSEMEAICIANIIKLNDILGELNANKRYLFHLAEKCLFITEKIKIQNKGEWYNDFIILHDKLKEMQPPDEDYNKKFKKIKEEHGDIFKEIDDQFISKKNESDFIKYILDKHPYINYEDDRQNRDFSKVNPELIRFLIEKYKPENYSSGINDVELQFFISHEISKKLNNLYSYIQ